MIAGITIRSETDGDRQAIRNVTRPAFDADAEVDPSLFHDLD